MFSRLIRVQLIVFAIASSIGMTALVIGYLQVPTYLGIGRITVTIELPATGGLYRFANVTYRGVHVGEVTSVELKSKERVEATLSLASSPKIPSDLRADVRSISAVGEQYVDLKPRANQPPYLHDGSVIPLNATSIPQPVGPVLDRTSALLAGLPAGELRDFIDESARGLGGAGFDLGSLLDSGATLSRDVDGVADNARDLIDDAGPLVDSQARSADDIRQWAHGLAGVTQQLTDDDAKFRRVLQSTPDFADRVGELLDRLKPTLPVLLANLTSVGQIAVTYNPSIEQLLVLLPPSIAGSQASLPVNNPTGMTLANFTLQMNDPPPCTVGFLPPSAWRSPEDTSTIDTPDGLYCKLPQDSPLAVRGARNDPCMDKPGKRAPTVEICKSDKPFEPLALRPHATGPYPLDPNLISQGIPPDSRVTDGDHLFGPIEGTPPPPQQPAAPVPVTPDPAATPTPTAPSSFGVDVPSGPTIAGAAYNPRTGSYLGPDGRLYHQTDIATAATPTSWTALMPTA